MTEKAFQSNIVQFAKLRRWLVYHTWNSQKSPAGFPDLVLVRGEKILYRELKTDKGKLTEAQKKWGDALTKAGADWQVWRPHMRDEIYNKELM